MKASHIKKLIEAGDNITCNKKEYEEHVRGILSDLIVQYEEAKNPYLASLAREELNRLELVFDPPTGEFFMTKFHDDRLSVYDGALEAGYIVIDVPEPPSPYQLEIKYMYIALEYQDSGLAELLADELLDYCKESWPGILWKVKISTLNQEGRAALESFFKKHKDARYHWYQEDHK